VGVLALTGLAVASPRPPVWHSPKQTPPASMNTTRVPAAPRRLAA